jgi:hypothetical protein
MRDKQDARAGVAAVAAFSALLLAAAGPVRAQTTTGNVRGFVRDAQGAPVSGAAITARQTETNQERTALSSPAGFYYIGGLRPGIYEVSIQMLGFAQQAQTVRVLIGQTQELNFDLSTQAVQLQGLEIVASRSNETRTSEVATNVTREQIENLPLRDRNFLNLAQLAPGVRAQQSGSERKTFSAGALPAEAVNVFVDGASYKNDVLQGGVAGQDASQGNPFPQNAVQEFRVITQNYKAEYQKAASAIITATTKSGGNAWEANAFAFNICSDCIARDAVQRRDNLTAPDFKRWQFGGSLGGPIQRDKLFFFGSYEGNFRDAPVNVVPGTPSTPIPGLNPQQFAGAFKTEFREHLAFGKVTYTPAPAHTFDFSANIRRETDLRGFGGQTSRESAENVKNNVYTGVGTWKYAAGAWLNEAQVSFQHYSWNPVPLDASQVGLNYQGVIRIGGRDTRQEFTQNRVSLRNDLTRSGIQAGGEHVFKAGVSVDLLSYTSIKDFVGNPLFEFRSNENYLTPFQALIGFGDPKIDANNTQFGVYLQDDWQLSSRIELNLGVRWDIETNMINNDYVTPQQIRDSLSGPLRSRLRPVVDELGGLDEYFTDGNDRPVYLGAIQPRIGTSIDLSGDQGTVLYGGFGIYFDRDFWNMMLDEDFRRQFKVIRMCFGTLPRADCQNGVTPWNASYFDPDQLRTLANTGNAGAPEIFLIRNDTRPPKNYQYSAGLRQRFGSTLVSATFAGSRGYNGYAYIFGGQGLGPAYSNLLIADPRVESRYKALMIKVEKALLPRTRIGGSLAYTLGKAEQKGDYFFALDGRFNSVDEFPWRPARDASGVGDQRHTVVLNVVTRLPYEIYLSSLMNFGSGFPQYATDCSAAGCGAGIEREYFYFPPKDPFLGMGHVFANQNVDLRAEKAILLPSGQRVSLAVDLFNAFNQANWGCYDAFIPAPGQTNNNFGRPNCASEGRRVQLGLRYGLQPVER